MRKPIFESEEEYKDYWMEVNSGRDISLLDRNLALVKKAGFIKKSVVEEAKDLYSEADISEIDAWSHHTATLIIKQRQAIDLLKKQLEEKKC